MVQQQSPHTTTKAIPHKAAHTVVRARQGAVLHLVQSLEAEDPAREIVDFAILAHRAGWPSFIASAGGALVMEAERAAVPHRRVPFQVRRSLVNHWRVRYALERIVQHDRPAILHAHGVDVLPHAASLARSMRLPLVADILHPLEATSAVRKLIAGLLALPMMFRVPSEFMGHHLIDVWKVPAERINFIPSGINLQWFSTGLVTPERLAALSKAWRLPEQGGIVLIPLPLTSGMGYEVFLEALASLRNKAVFAVLVGSDRASPGMRGELEKTISTLGLSGQVVMPEFCTDWPAALWHASAVVVPNTTPRGENRLLLAAQAMGRPVIVTDCGANVELVDPDATWRIKPHDIPALTEALREAVGLAVNHRLGLAERARDFIAAQFPQGAWLDDHYAIYGEVIAMAHETRRKVA